MKAELEAYRRKIETVDDVAELRRLLLASEERIMEYRAREEERLKAEKEASLLFRQIQFPDCFLPDRERFGHVKPVIRHKFRFILPVFSTHKAADRRGRKRVLKGSQGCVKDRMIGDQMRRLMILVQTVFPVIQHSVHLIFAHDLRQAQFFFLERYMASFTEEMKQFIQAIVNDTEVPVGIHAGLMSVVLAKAAKKSLDEHRPVKISEI